MPTPPPSCPHCGHPLGDAPVDAGAEGDTGRAQMVCTACGRIIRLGEEADD
jgi:hypothetical protein